MFVQHSPFIQTVFFSSQHISELVDLSLHMFVLSQHSDDSTIHDSVFVLQQFLEPHFMWEISHCGFGFMGGFMGGFVGGFVGGFGFKFLLFEFLLFEFIILHKRVITPNSKTMSSA